MLVERKVSSCKRSYCDSSELVYIGFQIWKHCAWFQLSTTEAEASDCSEAPQAYVRYSLLCVNCSSAMSDTTVYPT
jgi:hypothetical protein